MRSREYGALFVPVNIEAETYTFDLQDCICEINFNKELFDTFPQVRITFEGTIVYAYDIPHRRTKQIKVKSSQVINPLNAFCIVQRADSTSQKKCVLQDYGVFSVAPPTLVGWADCM